MPYRPAIALIATGGTIAGTAAAPGARSHYQSGVLDVGALLNEQAWLADIAEIVPEQPFSKDSSDITPADWLTLARRVRALDARPEVAGIVIAHGTDTLEETALFLQLTTGSAKPVVITGAMRPANAPSADGPANLYDACRVAVAPESTGRGVLVVFDGRIMAAAPLRKADTHALGAFVPQCGGLLGSIEPELRYYAPPTPRPVALLDPAQVESLPTVEVLHVAAGSSPALLDMAVAQGVRGVVLALPGAGTVPASWHDAVRRAVVAGVQVIRASRCGSGEVGQAAADLALGTQAAGALGPAQARVALLVTLAAGQRTLPTY